MIADPDATSGRTSPPSGRLRQLVDLHYGAVRRYAARRLPPADADDLVAEVFAVAWRRINDVPSGDQALPWLYPVAQNCLRNQARSVKRRLRLVRRMAEEPVLGPSADDDDVVLVALARLSDDDQELLRLVAWEELSYAEIAQILAVSENAVAIRVHRARGRLRHAIAAVQRSESLDQRADTRGTMRTGEEDG
jgi:RNA polymerase sigma-70 factor (ECF subfamily)